MLLFAALSSVFMDSEFSLLILGLLVILLISVSYKNTPGNSVSQKLP